MAKTVTRGYHTFADAYVILNFFRTQVINKVGILSPPVVREIVMQFQPSCGDHILMYSTDSSPQQHNKIVQAARQSDQFRFIVYGFNKDEESNNYIFKKTSTENFLTDLATCRAVVATAGFSLLSECLYFKKPMLLMPVHDQYEQIMNSLYIEKMNLGRRTKAIDGETINSFVRDIDTLSSDSEIVEWPDNERFFSVLDQTLNRINCPLNLVK